MNFVAIFLITFSAVLHIYWNYLLKKTINSGGDSSLMYGLSIISGTVLYSIPFLVFADFTALTLETLLFTAVCGFFLAFYGFFLGRAYGHGDLSQVYPLAKTTPLFTLIIGVFVLGETASLLALIGIFLIILGSYSIHFEEFSVKSFLQPIKSLKHKSSIFAVLSAMFSASNGLFSKVGLRVTDPLIFVYFNVFFLGLFYIPSCFIKKETVKRQFRKYGKQILKMGLLIIFAYSLIVVSLSFTQLSYVYAFRQISILLSVIVGSVFLKEKHGKTRIISSAIVFTGILLVGVS
jgi:drug/metabolite transporter (DMT)-like permease